MIDKKIIMTMFLTSNIYMNVYSDSSKEYVFMEIPSEIEPVNTNISSLGCNNWDPPLTYHCHVQGGNLF